MQQNANSLKKTESRSGGRHLCCEAARGVPRGVPEPFPPVPAVDCGDVARVGDANTGPGRGGFRLAPSRAVIRRTDRVFRGCTAKVLGAGRLRTALGCCRPARRVLPPTITSASRTAEPVRQSAARSPGTHQANRTGGLMRRSCCREGVMPGAFTGTTRPAAAGFSRRAGKSCPARRPVRRRPPRCCLRRGTAPEPALRWQPPRRSAGLD